VSTHSLVLLFLASSSAAVSVEADETTPSAATENILEPGRATRPIAGGEVQSFRVALSPGERLQIGARARGIDLRLALDAPDGRTLVDGFPVEAGALEQTLLWIPESAGTYVLRVKSPARETEHGTYDLQRGELRAPRPEERTRFEAQSLWLEARSLWSSPDPDRLHQAREKCEAGLALAHALGDPLLESRFLSGLAYVRSASGDPRGSLEFMGQAYERQRGRDPHQEIRSLLNLGIDHMLVAEYQKALEELEQSLSLAREQHDTRAESLALGNLGMLYAELKEFRKALRFYADSLPILEAAGDRRNAARNLGNMANAALALGELAPALEHYVKALALFRAEGDRTGEAVSLAGVASVELKRGRHDEAVTILNQALPLIRATGDRGFEIFVLRRLAEAYKGIPDYEKSRAFYREAFALATTIESPADRASMLLGAAALERDRGNLVEARRFAADVTSMLETARAGIQSEDLRLSHAALVRDAYDLEVDVLMRLRWLEPDAALDRTAFEISERGRARTLLEMLHEARVDVSRDADPALLAREATLRQQLSAKALHQAHPFAPSGSQTTPALEQEIGQLTRAWDDVRAQIRRTSPRYAALREPSSVKADEIQALLDKDTLLLEYHLAPERSYLWAVTPTSLASFDLSAARDVEALARRVHQALTEHNRLPSNAGAAERTRLLAAAEADYDTAARELSEVLLGALPLPRVKRLVIAADGVLNYVPFAALPLPRGWSAAALGQDARDPLVVRYEVVNLPSAAILAVLREQRSARQTAGKQIAVFADPVFDGKDERVHSRAARTSARESRQREASLSVLRASADGLDAVRQSVSMGGMLLPRLDYTRELAAAIVAGLPKTEVLEAVDFRASRETVLSSRLADYRTIVFATHGLLDTEYPALSGLVLSMVNEKGAPQDGFLRLQDVYNLRLNADLVVLGACETGLGKEVKSEGLVGLARGFMYAGASRVLASLWKVDEDATMELLKELFRSAGTGVAPGSAALRQAQLKLRSHPRWRSPFFWAGLVLQGDWD
jgi:CHAT domain-containing protein